MLCSILSLRAQTFVKPAVKVKDTSFAVITDKGTFQACEAELKAYQEILGMEGLPTFIVYNEWNKPEDVKKVIVKLFKKSANILPIIGTSKYAFTDGTYFSVSACIFAIALGVAPIPKPQVPAASTAAS